MTHRAPLRKQPGSLIDPFRRGVEDYRRHVFLLLSERFGQRLLAVQSKDKKPSRQSRSARRGSPGERKRSSPTRHHRHILHAVQFVRDRSRYHARADADLPKLLALVRAVSHKPPVGCSLENKVACRRQRSAVPHQVVLDSPSLLLGDWVPRQQVPARNQRRRVFQNCKVDAGVPGSWFIYELLVLRISEERLLRGNVDEPGLRVERHRLPVVPAERPRLHEIHRGLVSSRRFFDRPASRLIHSFRPTDLCVSLGRQQLAGLTVEHVEEPVLRGLHQNFAKPAADLEIGKNDVLGRGIVPRITRCGLIVPHQLAGLRAHGENRREIKIVAAAGASNLAVPGRAVAGPDIEQIEFGIVSERVPHCSAAAHLPPLTGPRLRGARERRRFKWFGRITGHGVEAPGELARFSIVSRHVAAHAELRSAVADDHFPFYDSRRAGDRVRLLLIDRHNLPEELAGFRVKRGQPSIDSSDVNPALVDRDSAIHNVAAGALSKRARHFRVPLPELLARARVDCKNNAPAPGREELTVHDDGSGFETAGCVGVENPRQAEAFDVSRVDLSKRAEARFGISASVSDPIALARVGVAKRHVVDCLGS